MRLFVKTVVVTCLFCGMAFAQSAPATKPKAAVYIMGNPESRDALRMAVNTFLVKSGKYQMVAVDAIDVVAREQKRQMSGSVSDGDIAKLGQDAGAEYVCVVERTELDGISYVATRMVNVQSKVAEFADMVDLPYGVKIIDIIQRQIGSMLGMAVGPRPSGSSQANAGGHPVSVGSSESVSRTTEAATSSIQGTIVPGGSLAEKLAWLQRSADSHNTYIVDVNTNETITPATFEFKGAINITIVLRGDGSNRTIRLQSHGAMFTVRQNVTFILGNNITLHGHNGNTKAMVMVEGGTFKMNAGATITGNTSSFWEGGSGGGGGGVCLYYGNGGTFEMIGGTISGNTARNGGGVSLSGGTFTMLGGTISGNTASESGGGVYMGRGIFTLRGGTITGNTATKIGGGVFAGHGNGTDAFTKIGGTITGYNSDSNNGNAVRDNGGNILARSGHAVGVPKFNMNGGGWLASPRKETTSGPGDNLSYSNRKATGAWDQ